jgi:hypothetical protein
LGPANRLLLNDKTAINTVTARSTNFSIALAINRVILTERFF